MINVSFLVHSFPIHMNNQLKKMSYKLIVDKDEVSQ